MGAQRGIALSQCESSVLGKTLIYDQEQRSLEDGWRYCLEMMLLQQTLGGFTAMTAISGEKKSKG